MADLSSVEIPVPLNWQDFQRACVILFRHVLRDPHAQEWGREGQDQHGIDVFGFRDSDAEKPVGVQCKRIEDPITEATLRKEIAKASRFKPRITELIFATTSDRDAKTQAICVRLTQELHSQGWPCRVVVMGWHDLRQEIVRCPDALEAFLPGASRALQAPVIEAVRDEGSRTRDQLEQQTALLARIAQSSAAQTVMPGDYDPDLEPDAHSESVSLHAKISAYREFIRKGRTKGALDELLGLLKQQNDLPPYARYRVIANIAAVHFNAGRCPEALDYAQQAHTLRPNDPKAQSNLALAELVNGDAAGALRRAQDVLTRHPECAQAGSALIQAKARLDGSSDPFLLVPDQIKGSAEVMCAAIVMLRQRHDPSWRELAASALAAHSTVDHLKRFAAEAELEPILSNPEIQIGSPLPSGATATVARCAHTLKELWEKEIGSEDVSADDLVPLAGNLASALRFSGDTIAAADVLDRSIAKAGPDQVLVRARALIHVQADEDTKAVELLALASKDPEIRLMSAQIQVTKAPHAALVVLNEIDPGVLPAQLREVIPEIRGEAALALNDAALLETSLDELSAIEGSFMARAMLRSRGLAAGLLQPTVPSVHLESSDADDEDGDLAIDDRRLPFHIQDLIREACAHEDTLTFSDRVQIALYLDHHGAYEAASNLLDGRVELTRDSVALRTYLSASVGAHMVVRAQTVLKALPQSLLASPKYRRTAAVHYWNTGDAASAAPLVEAAWNSAPQRLDLFLWHVECLLRLGQTERVRSLVAQCKEDGFVGRIEERARLASALSRFGQRERALRFGYREFARNRSSSAAWMGFMSVMFDGGESDDVTLLSEVISPDHAFSVKFPDGSERRFLIETDEEVRKIESDAYPPDHNIAKLVQGRTPGDQVTWPTGEVVTIIAAKHKFLDAFHTALARFNERFPSAKGFTRVRIKTEGDDALDELKVQLKARSDYVSSQSRLYGEGRMSLGMLAFMTGVDPIDVMLGLGEVGTAYRVAVGLDGERSAAFDAIAANSAKGCVVDAATYHCIRRLDLLDAVIAVCGPIGITQATADIYEMRLQKLSLFGDGFAGSMGYRDGKFYLTERTAADRDEARAIITADIEWLSANATILAARPLADPPPALRRLAVARNARFFDDVFAASGTERLLLVDDLFTRQVGGLIGVRGTSLQPVLMAARSQGILTETRYAKALTDLIGIGQTFISIDATTLRNVRQLDADGGEPGVGRRFTTALRALGGRHADPASHCAVVIEYLSEIWSNSPISLGDCAATSSLLRALLRERTHDYAAILYAIHAHLRRKHGFSTYLHDWARGHFLTWPAT